MDWKRSGSLEQRKGSRTNNRVTGNLAKVESDKGVPIKPGPSKRNASLVDRSDKWRISAPPRGRQMDVRRNRHKKRPSYTCPIYSHAEVGFPELVVDEGNGQARRLAPDRRLEHEVGALFTEMKPA